MRDRLDFLQSAVNQHPTQENKIIYKTQYQIELQEFKIKSNDTRYQYSKSCWRIINETSLEKLVITRQET